MGLLNKDPALMESPREQRWQELDLDLAADQLVTQRLRDDVYLKAAFEGAGLADALANLGVAVLRNDMSWAATVLAWRRLVAEHVEKSLTGDDIREEAERIAEGRFG